jgi:hypothetical protein
MARAFAQGTPAVCGRSRISALVVLAMSFAVAPRAWCQVESTNVATRFGPVETRSVPDATPARSDILFRGAPLGQVDGAAGLVKLSVQDDADYVLVDASQPDPQCRHRFVVLQLGPGDEATMSAPFGDCLAAFGARRAGDRLVIQLAQEGAAQPQRDPVVHEFVWTHDRMKELTNVLTRCEAAHVTAASRWTPVTSAQAARVVTGSGRAWFHTAPLEECRLPALFVIPGDVLTVLHVHGDYADVAYRNPRTGREAAGWLRLDRLAPAAAPVAAPAAVPAAVPTAVPIATPVPDAPPAAPDQR